MSSQEDFLVSLFPTQERGGGEKICVTSGRKCAELSTKSGRLGLLVKMLLESPQWWKDGISLRWDAIPLCSERWTEFTDTDSDKPSPLNESAETLRVLDTKSNRCLFRLRLSMLPTEETGSSSLPLMQTPTSVMTCENPESFLARKERNGYRNGTTYGSLESQVMYDPKFQGLLPTPMVIQGGACPVKDGKRTYHMDKKGGGFKAQLHDLAASNLLPTPRANKVTETDLSNPRIAERDKSNLEEEVARMVQGKILPTPTCNDAMNASLPKSQVERNDSLVKRILSGEMGVSIPKEDGQPFRLSPLFTEEMMGFPFLWTTLPFLRENGEMNPSKPTEMP